MTALDRASESAQLADWRSRDRAPTFKRVGWKIAYWMSDIIAWEQSQAETPPTT